MVTQNDIDELNPWFYQVDIDGHTTVPGIYTGSQADRKSKQLVNRQRCRSQLLLDEVAKRYDFSGSSVLDVACNCAYWSGMYVRRYGAGSLVGIEGRDVFIQQAHMLHASLGISDKTTIHKGNVVTFDYASLGHVDFVLCAGILYHIPDQDELLKNLVVTTPKVMVVDTRVSSTRRMVKEPRDRAFNAIDETCEKTVPVLHDLILSLGDLGYAVDIIHPTFETEPGVDGCDDYNKGRRVCLYCERK